jgi:hypothetical protein
MTDRARSDRTARLEALCWLALFAAITPNTVEAFANPSGELWHALRFGLSAVFAAVLLAVLASRFGDRRSR